MVERAGDLGGTWRDNTCPCLCRRCRSRGADGLLAPGAHNSTKLASGAHLAALDTRLVLLPGALAAPNTRLVLLPGRAGAPGGGLAHRAAAARQAGGGLTHRAAALPG